MKNNLIILFILAVSNAAFGQPDLQRAEVEINKVFALIAAAPSDADKQQLHDSIALLLDKALQLPDAFRYPFNDLNFLGKITSSDQQVRIFTWNMARKDGTNTYYGFLMKKAGNNYYTFRLTDHSMSIENPLTLSLDHTNWAGCLVYEIVDKKNAGETYYTLLGYDPENLFVTKKVIDVLWFQQNKPFFGKPIFRYNNRIQSRIIFEYSAKVRMSLVWNKSMNMIIFDHLVPSAPSHTGNFQFYGPDLSFDGLVFEKGIWEHRSNVDVRNY